MKFFNNFFSESKIEKPDYSVSKLKVFLDEWAQIMAGNTYAGDNQKRDELQTNIVKQVSNLTEEQTEKAFESSILTDEEKRILRQVISDIRKS